MYHINILLIIYPTNSVLSKIKLIYLLVILHCANTNTLSIIYLTQKILIIYHTCVYMLSAVYHTNTPLIMQKSNLLSIIHCIYSLWMIYYASILVVICNYNSNYYTSKNIFTKFINLYV